MKPSAFKSAVFAGIFALFSASLSADDHGPIADFVGTLPNVNDITEADIRAAQKMWGDAVVQIGAAGKKAPEVAKQAAEAA